MEQILVWPVHPKKHTRSRRSQRRKPTAAKPPPRQSKRGASSSNVSNIPFESCTTLHMTDLADNSNFGNSTWPCQESAKCTQFRYASNFVRDVQDTNFRHFRKVHPPPLESQEQATIADHLDSEISRIDSLVTPTQKGVDRLGESRSALMFAVSISHFNVENWHKQDSTNYRL